MTENQRSKHGATGATIPVVLDQAQIDRLDHALGRLRARDRAIFLASSKEHLPYAEIAVRHRCSVEEVRRTIARVLVKLHQAVWPGE